MAGYSTPNAKNSEPCPQSQRGGTIPRMIGEAGRSIMNVEGSLAMRSLAQILFVSLAVALSGCGGSGTITTPPTYPSLTGNWELTGSSAPGTDTFGAGAYLTNTNGSVSGIIYMLDMGCYLTPDNQIMAIPVTGTVSAAVGTLGVLSVTSSAVAGQVLSLSGTVSSDTLLGGTYSIIGGCAGGDKGTVTGYMVPPYTNTYSGTLGSTINGGVAISTTIITTQSGPDADGFYHVTGTATFNSAGAPCLISGTITSSTITGMDMNMVITANDGSLVSAGGFLTDSSGQSIVGSYTITGSTCISDTTGVDVLSVVREP